MSFSLIIDSLYVGMIAIAWPTQKDDRLRGSHAYQGGHEPRFQSLQSPVAMMPGRKARLDARRR